MAFWVVVVVLLSISIFIVLRPLRSKRLVNLESNRERNIAIAKERRNEINSAYESGDLTQAESESAMQDLETALADELSTSAALPDTQGRAPKIATSLILMSIPIIAIGMYLQTGTVNYEALTEQSELQQASEIPSLDELVTALEAKIRANPSDERGLFLLAQTYNRIGRHQESVATYQILIDTVGPNADLLTEQAEATVMQNQQVFSAQSLRLLSEAVALNPHHIKARWLSGLGKLELGDAASALENWLWIEDDLKADPEAHTQLISLIKDAQQALGAQSKGVTDKVLQNIQIHNESTEHQQLTNRTEVEKINSSSAQNLPTELKVEVTLAPSLSETVEPSDTVFIIVKAQSGLKAPLAAVRKMVVDLPLSLTLDDSDAMLDTLRLSQFEEVVISARISKSGQVSAQAGDIKSVPRTVKTTYSKLITLTLNEVVK